MSALIEVLFLRNGWAWRAEAGAWPSAVYRGFNLAEGAVWLVLAGLVLRRHIRFRQSRLEVIYAGAFFSFALSDFREAWSLDSWLIWLKAVNLGALLWLRRRSA